MQIFALLLIKPNTICQKTPACLNLSPTPSKFFDFGSKGVFAVAGATEQVQAPSATLNSGIIYQKKGVAYAPLPQVNY